MYELLEWTADYTNDPYNDYEVIVEILCNDEDVAVIRQTDNGLELKWYANQKDLMVPLEWLSNLLLEAKKRLKSQ
jgi:hypothetical protein